MAEGWLGRGVSIVFYRFLTCFRGVCWQWLRNRWGEEFQWFSISFWKALDLFWGCLAGVLGGCRQVIREWLRDGWEVEFQLFSIGFCKVFDLF